MRVKSKATDDSNLGVLLAGSSRALARSRSITRLRSKSRTRGKSADGMKGKSRARPRSNSLDPVFGMTSGLPMRGRRKNIVEAKKSESEAARAGIATKFRARPRSNSLDPVSGVSLTSSDLPMRGRRKTTLEAEKSETEAARAGIAMSRRKDSGSEISTRSTHQEQEKQGDQKTRKGKSVKALTNQVERESKSDADGKASVKKTTVATDLATTLKDTASGQVDSTGLGKALSTNSFQRRAASVGSPRSVRSKDSSLTQSASGTKTEKEQTRGDGTNVFGLSKSRQRSEKDGGKLKQRSAKSQTDTQGIPNATKVSPPYRKSGRTMSAGSKSKSSSKKVASEKGSPIDRDIQEALQRHNLGSAVSTLVLGSAFSSPSEKSKKDAKKRRRMENQKKRDVLPSDIAFALIENEGDTSHERFGDSPVASKSIKKQTKEQSPSLEIQQLETENDNDKSLADIEKLRLQVRRARKSATQRMSELRSRTEEEILTMEHEMKQQKAMLVQKLESLGVKSDPAKGVKYLCSTKVAKLHEEGKQLRKEMKKIEDEKIEQVSLTNQLISESVDIQRQTGELVTKISQTEMQNSKHAMTLNALRLAHSSISSVLDEDGAKR